jgi:hypothetical protein
VASGVCLDNRSKVLRSRHLSLIRFMHASFPFRSSLNLDHFVKELFMTNLNLPACYSSLNHQFSKGDNATIFAVAYILLDDRIMTSFTHPFSRCQVNLNHDRQKHLFT